MIITDDKRESWKTRVDAIDYGHRDPQDKFFIPKKDIKKFYSIKNLINSKIDLNENNDRFLNQLFIEFIRSGKK